MSIKVELTYDPEAGNLAVQSNAPDLIVIIGMLRAAMARVEAQFNQRLVAPVSFDLTKKRPM